MNTSLETKDKVIAVAKELTFTPRQAADRIVHLVMRDHQEQQIEAQFWVCCLNCHEWNKSDKVCSKYKALPPPEVLVVGCPDWLSVCPF